MAAARAQPRAPHWLVALLAAVGLVLIPWTTTIGLALPSVHVARHWDVVWTGFDLALSIALLATALAAARRSPLISPIAAGTGTLLLCDAWFDTLTASTRSELWTALLLALLAELPLATLCFVLAARPADALRGR